MYKTKRLMRSHRPRGRLVAVFLALAISFSILAPAMSFAAEDGAPESMEDFPDGTGPEVTVYRVKEGGYFGDELKNGDELSLSDNIGMLFSWDRELPSELKTGVSYLLCELPNQLVLDQAESITLTADGEEFAILSTGYDDETSRWKIWIQFSSLENIFGVHAGISFHLAEDVTPDNTKGEVEIAISGMKEAVTIVVPELLPKGPSLAKRAGAIDNEGQVTWAVTYTPAETGYAENNGEAAIPDAVKLVDTLPNGMEYVPGSAELKGTSLTDGNDIVYDETEHTLTFQASTGSAAGQKMELTYVTRMTDETVRELWTNGGTKNFTNSVVGFDEQEEPIADLSDSATANADKEWVTGHAALNKSGSYAFTGGNRTATWTVTVNTVGRSFQYLKVVDTLGKGLTLDASSIKVNGNPVNSHYEDVKNGDGATTLTIHLYKDGTANFADTGTYTITYTTTVSDDYFQQTPAPDDTTKLLITDEDVKNKATLEWRWLSDNGTGEPHSITRSQVTPAGLSSNMLANKGISYDQTTRILTWQITVNSNLVDIQSAVLEDRLRNDGVLTRDGETYLLELAYQDGEELKKELEEAINAALPSDRQDTVSIANVNFITAGEGDSARNIGFALELSNLGETSFTFQVKARMLSPSFWATNQEHLKSAWNDAELRNVTLTGSGGTLAQTFKASGGVDPSSNMLEKTHVSYDPNTREITWQLTINKNQTDGLGKVTVTDALPEGLTYVPGSTTFNNTPLEDDGTVSVVDENRSITWTLSDENENTNVNGKTVTLKFKTSINEAGQEAFLTDEAVSFTNKATLRSDAHETDLPEVSSTATLKNQVLSKEKPLADGNRLTYRAELNPHAIELLGSEGQQLYLEDIMPAGLVPDLDSIQLYEATVTASKGSDGYTMKLTTGKPVSLEAGQISYWTEEQADGTVSNVFQIPVEDETPYILEYDAYVVQTNVTLTNEIRLVSSAIDPAVGQGVATSSYRLRAFGGAIMRLPAGNWSLQVTKTDGKGAAVTFTEEQMTAGAVPAKFGLYSAMGENAKLLEAVCDRETGVCTFSQPTALLNDVTKLYLKELGAPTGYVANDQWRALTAEQIQTLQNKGTVELKIINISEDPDNPGRPGSDALTGAIRVVKTYEGGTPDDQAKFALYRVSFRQIIFELLLAPTYRLPKLVTEVRVFPERYPYGVCPRCKITLEREYQKYCDRCGQRLDWSKYDDAKVQYMGCHKDSDLYDFCSGD